MKNFEAILKSLLKSLQIFAVCALFSSVAMAVPSDKPPQAKTEVAQKIAKLKAELADAKGKKRIKLIKKIAEMENKVLEHKLQSFR